MNARALASPRTALCIALVGGALLPTAALAQAAASDALEEVIVTAQRKTERLQDVPIAITALTGADLEARGVRQAADIVQSVPNLTLSLPYGQEAQPTFSLRGVTTNDWSQNQSSPIAMYVDDVYKPVGAVQALQTYDLDRVEVLRGPQGTLYGKNATGGAINFYSRSPNLTQYDGYLTAGLGNYNSRMVDGAIGGPIVDEVLGWRLAVLYDQRDGWVRSVVPGVEPLNSVDAAGGRLSLLYKPTATLSALLKVAVTRSGGTPYGAHAINVDNDPTSPTYVGTAGDYGWYNSGAKYAIHKKLDNDSASLKIDWQISQYYTLTAVTGFDYGVWWERSDDGALSTTDAGAAIHIDDPNLYSSSINSFSQELRIASHDTGRFGWLAGAFYGRDNTHYVEQFHFFDSTVQGYFVTPDGQQLWGYDEYNNFDQIRTSKALFLNATFNVAPTVTLRAGLRYTHDDISIQNFYALEGGMTNQPTVLGPDSYPTLWTQTIPYFEPISYLTYQTSLDPQGGVNPELTHSDSNVSVKVGVDWKISDDVLGYLSFSQGYRGAAFNGQAFNGPAELTFANPEKLDAYELGVKSSLLGKRLELNGAVFYYDYRDQQFLDTYCAFPTPTGCAGTGFVTSNAPKSQIVGGELELHARPTPALDLRASLGLLNSKYEELYLHFASRNGNQLIMAPEASGALAVDWRVARFDIGDLHLAADGNYYGKQYFDALNTERIAQPAYSVFNARASLLASHDNRLSFAIWCKNLTDRHYLSYGLAQRNIQDGGLGFDYALVGEPRTYGLEVTLRY
ncbi:MAG TPA: TonB-dependent receptor [Steroidobacteraceae bacterium]|nr:TonB-dependent receptor [Steroidobacteraceae bacterium]